jgi:dipeptidyl-peptidase-4
VKVFIYDLSSGKTIGADTGEEKDQYIPRIKFTANPETLAILRLNRLQNKLEILKNNVVTGASEVMYTEENKYYIDEGNFDYITFSPDGKSFVLTSEQDGWNHLYQYDMTGKLIKQITKGEFDVTDYYGYDASKKLHYYQAAAKSPLQREIYSVKSDGSGVKMLTEKPGTNRATFSSSFKYFIHTYSSVTTPPVYTLRESSGKEIRLLEDNSELVEKLKEYDFNYREFFTIETPEGVKLNALAIYPPDFDSTKKYPVVINQYSGPNSQQVLDSWSLDYDDYLAQEGFVLVSVDPRGTGARGEEFRKMTYLQLGKYETIDQINSARYLANMPWVDGDRIGIWGWSYGGFISASCMLKSNGVFSVGVAVAPVTNWRYYDNIYTERFMRKPQDNKDGYDSNSPLFFADQLKGKLLLVHGTADDNVHVQNTLELAERLVQAEKQFDMMLYTNRNHSIFGGNTRMHLHRMITNYFKENL